MNPCVDLQICVAHLALSFNGINRLVLLSLAELRQIFLFHQVALTCFITDHPTRLWGTYYVFHSRGERLHMKSGRAREILWHRAPATSSSAVRCQADFTDSTTLLIDGWFITWLPSSGLQLRQKTMKQRQGQILHKQHFYVHVSVGLVRGAGFLIKTVTC